jgi:hypothetical protein
MKIEGKYVRVTFGVYRVWDNNKNMLKSESIKTNNVS